MYKRNLILALLMALCALLFWSKFLLGAGGVLLFVAAVSSTIAALAWLVEVGRVR
jgi:hypothetical protein